MPSSSKWKLEVITKIWTNGKKFEQMKMMITVRFYGLLVGKMADQSGWSVVSSRVFPHHFVVYTGCAILINPSLYSWHAILFSWTVSMRFKLFYSFLWKTKFLLYPSVDAVSSHYRLWHLFALRVLQLLRHHSYRRSNVHCSLFRVMRPLTFLYTNMYIPKKLEVIHKVHRLRWSRGSVLTFSTQVCGFKPGRSLRIFRAKKSSARLPSEEK